MSSWTDLRDDIREAFLSQIETRPHYLTAQATPNSTRKEVSIPVQYLGFFPKTRTYSITKSGQVMVYDTRTETMKIFEIKLSFKRLCELVENIRKEYFSEEISPE